MKADSDDELHGMTDAKFSAKLKQHVKSNAKKENWWE